MAGERRREEKRRGCNERCCLKRRAYLLGCCSALLAVAMAVYTTKQHHRKEGVTLAGRRLQAKLRHATTQVPVAVPAAETRQLPALRRIIVSKGRKRTRLVYYSVTKGVGTRLGRANNKTWKVLTGLNWGITYTSAVSSAFYDCSSRSHVCHVPETHLPELSAIRCTAQSS
jgi:hypothetical protein